MNSEALKMAWLMMWKTAGDGRQRRVEARAAG
jgi:hypothetical protein